MLARTRFGAPRIGRHREGRPGRAAGRTEAVPEAAQPAVPSAARGRPGRRRSDLPQDQAMYACQCGYVFRAQVSTSVGCPRCGGTQAW